ncbi:hypothetical protein FRB94_001071 [Tulasnella sp. JGI-2019a]|nr:hypothetical protein FRB93_000410 [Tulasnella sp. JGI-2019a]KAG9005943.1 hypothetical protein FRB94_001071 [Tulasnella sp. JGI-2019a]
MYVTPLFSIVGFIVSVPTPIRLLPHMHQSSVAHTRRTVEGEGEEAIISWAIGFAKRLLRVDPKDQHAKDLLQLAESGGLSKDDMRDLGEHMAKNNLLTNLPPVNARDGATSAPVFMSGALVGLVAGVPVGFGVAQAVHENDAPHDKAGNATTVAPSR